MINIYTMFTSLFLCTNMNGNVYSISNPNSSSGEFSTEFLKINSTSEYFDVYSHPITSQYSEVYWTMMSPVDLPENIIRRFSGKTIAIVGYEVNQVFINQNGSETPVPITWAYNHHYEAYLRNSKASFYQVSPNSVDVEDVGQFNHGAKAQWRLRNLSISNPNSLYFSEANGGEFRASFHGYPNGYAQLLDSPRYFDLQPMQIDTRNRDPRYINDTKFHAGLMPKNSAAPPDAVYSGLLECPCTTRINKTITHFYNNLLDGLCKIPITNTTSCFTLSKERGMFKTNQTATSTIHESSAPYGCFFNASGSYVNEIYNKSSFCGTTNETIYGWVNDTITGIHFATQISSNKTHILLSGPADVWFGIAFGATAMKDLPYSIIVEGSGNVFEQKLGNHGPGTRLNSTFKVLYQTVIQGQRTVSLERTYTNNYFDFSNIRSDVNILLAYGSTPTFSYHRGKTTNQIMVKMERGNTCICDDGKIGTINGIRFQKNCRPEPYGDLVRQHNPSCWIETYQGGQSCCHHKWLLVDIDQKPPTHQMTYHLKFRFWFQDFQNHKRMVRAYYQTEAYSGEYDIPQSPSGTPTEERIHSITARWQTNEMVNKEFQKGTRGFSLIYAAPHCHAPMCIDMELYNSDTGELLCHVDGILGKGNMSKSYDEEGYIKLNPCLWGEDAGLMKPGFLSWDSNLTSIKRANSTYKHFGEMASWQMRGVVIN